MAQGRHARPTRNPFNVRQDSVAIPPVMNPVLLAAMLIVILATFALGIAALFGVLLPRTLAFGGAATLITVSSLIGWRRR